LLWYEESGESDLGTWGTHAPPPAIAMIAKRRRQIRLRRVYASRSFTRIFYLFPESRVIPLSGSGTAWIKSAQPH
jgi:hypothetical protein